MSLLRSGCRSLRSRHIVSVVGFLVLAFLAACLDTSLNKHLRMPTGPDRFIEPDYDTYSCPNCYSMSAKQKQAALAAIIQIQDDCPGIGDWLMGQYNGGSMFAQTDPNYYGKFYYNQGNGGETVITSLVWNNTTNDSLYETLRHEGYHGLYNDADEDAANLAETVCPP